MQGIIYYLFYQVQYRSQETINVFIKFYRKNNKSINKFSITH